MVIYWKTAYTNTDGGEFAKYFKLNDSIPNSYVEILLVDIDMLYQIFFHF